MFSEKKLRVEITLYEYSMNAKKEMVIDFATGKTLVFDDYAIDCKIKKVPSTCGYTASLDIFGISQESIGQITTIAWIDGMIRPRQIRIYADDGDGYSLLFEGGIMEAVPNYTKAPDISIHIESSMLVYPNLESVPPISLERGTSIFSFCLRMFAPYSMTCIPSPLLMTKFWTGGTKVFAQNSIGQRLLELSRVANLEYFFTTSGVRIVPKGTDIQKTFDFTPNDYVGYPTFENFGIVISLDWLNDINCGDKFKITGSVVDYANSTWVVNTIDYHLQSRKPNGAWQIKVHGTRIIDG